MDLPWLISTLLTLLIGVPAAAFYTLEIIEKRRHKETTKANDNTQLAPFSALSQGSRGEKVSTTSAEIHTQNKAGSIQPKASSERVEERRMIEPSKQSPPSQARGSSSDGNDTPTPSLSSTDTDALYREVMISLTGSDPAIHNIIRAIPLLREVLHRDPTFDKGGYAAKIVRLLRQQAKRAKNRADKIAIWQWVLYLRPGDLEAEYNLLRLQANVARSKGDWDDEIRIWQKVLAQRKEDKEASRRLEIAIQNRDCGAERYKAASEIRGVRETKTLLKELWRDHAPYYGDPGKLLERLDIHDPLENIPLAGWRKDLYVGLLFWTLICMGAVLSTVIYLLLPWGRQNHLFGSNLEAVQGGSACLVMAIICFVSLKILTKRFLL